MFSQKPRPFAVGGDMVAGGCMRQSPAGAEMQLKAFFSACDVAFDLPAGRVFTMLDWKHQPVPGSSAALDFHCAGAAPCR